MRVALLPILTGLLAVGQAGSSGHHIKFKPIPSVTSDSLHNIHIEYGSKPFTGNLQMIYGDCHLQHQRELHHFIGQTEINLGSKPRRFVWIVPEDAKSGGCLHAFSNGKLMGRSAPINVRVQMRKRQSIADVADIDGPWFDGVAYMKSRNNSESFVAAAKNKSERASFEPILSSWMATKRANLLQRLRSSGVEWLVYLPVISFSRLV